MQAFQTCINCEFQHFETRRVVKCCYCCYKDVSYLAFVLSFCLMVKEKSVMMCAAVSCSLHPKLNPDPEGFQYGETWKEAMFFQGSKCSTSSLVNQAISSPRLAVKYIVQSKPTSTLMVSFPQHFPFSTCQHLIRQLLDSFSAQYHHIEASCKAEFYKNLCQNSVLPFL